MLLLDRNAITWQCPGAYQQFHHRAIAYGGGRFVTVGNSYATPATHTSSISTDGSSWTEIPTLMNQQANTILYAPTHQRFYAVFGNTLGELRDGNAVGAGRWRRRERAQRHHREGRHRVHHRSAHHGHERALPAALDGRHAVDVFDSSDDGRKACTTTRGATASWACAVSTRPVASSRRTA